MSVIYQDEKGSWFDSAHLEVNLANDDLLSAFSTTLKVLGKNVVIKITVNGRGVSFNEAEREKSRAEVYRLVAYESARGLVGSILVQRLSA